MKIFKVVCAKIFHEFCKLIPVRNVILLESLAGFDGSSRSIYNYLKNSSDFKKYRFVWMVNDKREYRKFEDDRTEFINYNEICLDKERAKYIFWEYLPGSMHTSNQISVWLSHGQSPLKKGGSYSIEGHANYYICTSKDMSLIVKQAVKVNLCKEIICELPRNDSLFHPYDIKSYIGDNKVIIFMPTFRQSNKLEIYDSVNAPLFDMPAIPDKEKWRELNSICSQKGIVVIVKPHPNSNFDMEAFEEYSNVLLLTNQMLRENDWNLYRLLGASDALLTDYSSVSFDYLLLDKPIAYDVVDLLNGDYSRVDLDNPYEWMPGKLIQSFEDVVDFVEMVADGEDLYSQKRKGIAKKVHTYFDDKNTERLIEKLGIK